MPNDGISPDFPWPVASSAQPAVAAAAPAPADDGKAHVWAQKGFQFHDLLDIVNPLQHLPVVSSIYRWITGDGIGNLPRVVGDALYGGPIGFVSGLLGVLVKEESGKDIGEHVIATLTGGSDSATGSTQAAAPAAVTDTSPTANAASSSAATTTTPAASAAVADAASTPPQAPTAAVPDHPPIPLGRGAATGAIAAPPPAASGASKNPVEAFRSEFAQRERPFQQRPATENGRVLTSQPVPMQIPSGVLGTMAPQPRAIKVMASPPATPAATTSDTPATVPPPDGRPIEISQKMLQALDKYMALQPAARGAQVDVSP
jgi:hypothetical protein